uniref:Sugar transporter SWEET n=1 Tax=Acrobeloides nanus TaxID=290746 RepID=A0A914BXR3_9BILA
MTAEVFGVRISSGLVMTKVTNAPTDHSKIAATRSTELCMAWVDVLSFTATCSTICLFMCGTQIISRIHKHGTTEGTGIAPFLLTAISCAGWTGYGVLKNDGAVILVNGVGLVIQSLYLLYYYRMTHYPRKRNITRLLLFTLFLYTVTFLYVQSDRPHSEKENYMGLICMLLTIATIGSPLVDVGQVIRTKSTESMPFMLCVTNMAVSVQWLLYGILVDDIYMKIPNFIAVLISGMQLSLFIVYPPNSSRLPHKSSDIIL